MEFREECEEFLNPYNYTIHSFSSDKKIIVFTNTTDSKIFDSPTYPVILCAMDNKGDKTMELTYMLPKGFIKMNTGKLMFKHPNFEFFLNKMREYIKKIIT